MENKNNVRFGVPKKALSVFLSILMVISVVAVAFPAMMTLAATVSQEHWKIAIGVPETIYTTAANNYSTGNTGIRWYVNNIVDTGGAFSLEKSATTNVGKFYIYCSEISSINSITCDNANLSGLAPTKTGSLWSDTSFTMTLKSGLSSSNTRDIEWTISCTLTDGTSATFYAYTVAYAPYLSPIFAAGAVKNTRGNNSWGSGLSWVSGIHGISGEAGYYPNSNFLPVTADDHPTQGGGESNPGGWFNSSQQCGLPTKGGYYHEMEFGNNTGDTTDATFERSGEGYINVDTSRYDNLNQVPNLTCGIYVTDAEGNSDGNLYGYVGKLNNAGDRITSGRDWHTDSTTEPGEWNASVSIWAGDRTTGRNKNYAQRNVRMNTAPANGWMYIRGAFYTHDAGDRCFDILDCYLNVITVDKSAWRTAVNNAQNWGFQRGWFTNGGDFDTWKGYLKTVACAVGNPLTTSCSTTNLSNQTNALAKEYNTNNSTDTTWRAEVRDFGVVKVLNSTGAFSNQWKVILLPDASNTANTISNPTDYKTVRIGDKVRLQSRATSSAPYSAFTYLGNLKISSANYKAQDATFTNASASTGIGFDTSLPGYNSTDYTYQHITQTRLTNGEHRRAYYYQGKDVNVTVNPNGGTWNGTTNNSTVTGSYKTSWDLALPTRTGYYFDGWEFVDSNGNADSTKGTDGIYSETFTTQTVNEVTKKTFTKTNFVFGRTGTVLRAKWVAAKYYLDVNGWLYTVDNDGATSGNLGNKAKATVSVKTYSNGAWSSGYSVHTSGSNVNDFYSPLDYSTPYKISVTPIAGWKMDGIKSVTSDYTYTTDTNTAANVTVSGTIPTKNVAFSFAVRPKVIHLTLDSKYYYGTNLASSENATTAGTGNVYYKFEQSAAQDTSNTSITGTYFTSGSNANNTVTGKITSITPPTKTGYTFAGYYTGKSGTGTQYINASGTFVGNPYSTVTADTTLYAYWTKDTYTITYDLDGGALANGVTNPSTYQVDTATFTLNNPLKTGYTFKGWTGSNGTTPQTSVSIAQGSTGNKNYTANWNKDTYTITYHLDGGTVSTANPTTYQVDTATFTLNNPTKTGYIFKGWVGSNGATPQTSVSIAQGSTGNKEYTAQWEAIKYNIAYAGNGSTGGTAPSTQTNISYDTDATLSANSFTRSYVVTFNANGGAVSPEQSTASYGFAGWKYDGTTYQPGDTVSNLTATNGATVTMEAQWTPTSVNLPTPTRDGYTFKGWHVGSLSGTKLTGTTYQPSAATTLVAEWEADTYTATFNANGGSVNPATKDYTIEQSLALPTPTRTGYTFTGWKVTTAAGNWTANVQFAATDTSVPAGKWGDVTFTAQWDADPFTVHFVGTNATSGSMQDQGFLYNETKALSSNGFNRIYTVTFDENYEGKLTPMATATSTYAIDGWATTENGAKVYGDAETVAGSALYPGKNGTKNLYIVWKDGDVTLAGGNRAGYYIEGWYRTVSGSTFSDKVGAPGDTYKPTQTETLYAKWEPITYNVEYNANTGTGTAPASHTNIIYNQEITIAANTFTKTGYHFTGWNTRADGTGTPYNANQTATNLSSVAGTVTLYAQWEANKYTVTYDYNYTGHPANATAQATYDVAWPTAPTYTRDGYDFAGWYNEDTCTNAVSMTGNYTIAGNKTVYAKWTPKSYTVTLKDSKNSSWTQTQTYNIESTGSVQTVSKDGYTFAGWTVSDNTGNWNETSYGANKSFTGMYGNVTLTAQWTLNPYTITYDTKGGDAINALNYNIESTDVLPEAVRTGYVFAGWKPAANAGNWSASATYAKNTPVTGKFGNVTLEAQWTALTYTVAYNANGGSGAPASVTKTYGTPISIAATKPTRNGYAFIGWHVDQNALPTATGIYQSGVEFGDDHYTGPDCTVTLYAVWKAETYTFAYDANTPAATGNTVNMNGLTSTPKTFDTNTALSATEPTLEGYTFTGWNTAANGSGTDFAAGAALNNDALYTAPNCVVTLYAQWTAIGYEVSFDGNDATSGEMANQPFDYDEEKSLTANAYERKYTVTYNYNNATGGNTTLSVDVSYGFAGWHTSALAVDAATAAAYTDGQTVKNLRTTAGTFPLYAKWTSNAATLPTPTRDGYTFAGWNTAADGSGTNYGASASYTPTADITLHAQWTLNRYTITYTDTTFDGQANNAAGTANYYITAATTDGAVTSLKTPERTGYDFTGWAVTANAGNWTAASYAGGTSVENMYGNVTLNATWIAHTYTVAYDANGGEGAPASHSATYDQTFGLATGRPTRTGYTFLGWSDNQNAAAARWQPGDRLLNELYPGKGNTATVYAVWSANTYTVSFNGNGATTGTMADQNFTYDEEKNLNASAFGRSHTVTYNYNYTGSTGTNATAAATFANWTGSNGSTYTDGQAVKNLTSDVNGSFTMTANWTLGTVTLPAPERTGYTFGGWYAEAACTNKIGDGNASYTVSEDKELFAKWTAVEYTVAYSANTDDATVSGIPTGQNKIYAQDLILSAAVPTRDGYTFRNWNTAADGNGTTYVAGATLNTDYASVNGATVTLYAVWEANRYVIHYAKGADAATGTTADTELAFNELSSKTLAACTYTYTGYTFLHWKIGETTFDAGAPVTAALLVNNGVKNTEDGKYHLTLTAEWERNTSKVQVYQHKLNGTLTNVLVPVTVGNSGETLTLDPQTLTGYTFSHWAFENEHPTGTISGNTYTYGEASSNVVDVIYGVWTANTYSINYKAADGQSSDRLFGPYAYDSAVTLQPEDLFTRTGFEIVKWWTEYDETTGAYSGRSLTPGATVDKLNLTAVDGATVNLYAEWREKDFTVTVVPEEGYEAGYTVSPAANTAQTIYYGGDVTYTVTLKDGYTQTTFADLDPVVSVGNADIRNIVKNGNVITFKVHCLNEGNITVTMGKAKLNTYTVTLNPAGEDWAEAEMGYRRPTVQATVIHGNTVSFSIATLTGYHLDNAAAIITATVGGTTVPAANIEVTGAYTYTIKGLTGAGITGDLVITMQNADKNRSTVNFYVDDAVYATAQNAYGATYTVTAPTKTGYTFTGWARRASSTAAGTLTDGVYTFGASLGTDAYDAQFTPNNYTITFSQEAAAGDPAWAVITKGTLSKPVTFDAAMPAIDNLPTRVGYDFLGYTYTDGGTDYRYNASGAVVGEDKYTTAGNTTMYAKWQKHVYSITLDGTPVGYTVEYPHNAYYNDTYTFTVTPDAGYDVNAINVNVTGNGGFTTAIADGVMTVSVTGVTADNVISVSGALLTYNIVTNLVNAEAFAAQPATVTVNYNTSGVTVEVTMADGYQQNAPTVAVETTQEGLTASVSKKDGTDATYVIALSDAITADVTLNLTGKKNTYTVTLNGTEVGYTLPATHSGSIEYLGSVTYEITLAEGYTQTDVSDISVTEVNGHAVLTKTDDTHITVVITSEQPGDVTVTLGNAKANTYTLTFVNNGGDTLTVNAPVPATTSTIGWFDTFTFSITLKEGYTEAPPALTADNNDVTITASKAGSVVTYTVKDYFKQNTTLTLAPADANTSKLTVDLDGGTLAGVEAEYTGAYKDILSFGKPTKDGYTFVKWVLGGDENGTLAGESSASAAYTFGPTANATDTLTATWTANTYKVNYYKNDGTDDVTSKDVTFNGSWPAAPTFTRTGYDFAGWFQAADGDAEATVTGTYTKVGDTDVYAHWNKHTSTLKVDPNEGKVVIDSTEYTAIAQFTKEYQETVSIATPTRKGYTFSEWERTGNNGSLVNGTYTFGPAKDVTDTFKALWTANTYTVAYVKNDGTSESTNLSVTFDQPWPTAPAVTRTGWTFTGWYTEAEGGNLVTFEGNYTKDENTTVYAHWTINTSTVKFDPAEGTITLSGSTYTHDTPYTVTDAFGETVSAPTPVRTGYTFTGWARTGGSNGTLENGVYTFGATKDAIDVFTAQWQANTYTVIFDGNGGAPTSQSKTAIYDAPWPTAAEPTRTGYDFANWYTDAEAGALVDLTQNYVLTEGTTVYAHWTIHTSTVTVKANGGNWNGSPEDKSYTGAYGSTQAIPVPTREGWHFTGWTLSDNANGSLSGNTYTFGSEKINTDVITANWEIDTFTVTVVTGEGYVVTAGPNSPVNWNTDSSVTIRLDEAYSASAAPTATVNNGTVATTVNADGTITYTVSGIKENKTITIGDAVRNEYDVTAVLADGAVGIASFTPAAAVKVQHAIGTTTVTVTLADGYSNSGAPAVTLKAGGAAQISGGVKSTVNGKTVYTYTVSNVTKASEFEIASATPNTYAVTYEKNDGTGANVVKEVTFDAAWPEAPAFERTGYTPVDGWFTGAADTAPAYTFTDTYTTVGNTTVYKHWTIHKSKVNVVLAGGTGATESEYEQNYNTKLTLAEPTRVGYTFAGWVLSTGANGSLSGNEYTFGAANGTTDTVTAQWTKNTYTIRYNYNVNGSSVAAVSQRATYDENVTLLGADTFERTGYTLSGWAIVSGENAEKVYDPGEALTKPNFTATAGGFYDLYAVWTIHTSTLKVDPNTGTVNVDGTDYTAEQSFTQNYNTTVTVNDPTKEGYHFTGWTKNITNGTFTDGVYRFGAGEGLTDTLKANWEIDTFTVAVIAGVGYEIVSGPNSPVEWNTDSSVTIRLDEAYSASAAPTATVNNGTVATTVNADGTITYTVTGIKENKTIVIGDAVRNEYNVTLSVPEGTKGIASYSPTEAVSVQHGIGTATVTVTLADGYSNSGAPAVTLKAGGAAEISGGVKSTVNGKTVYTYTVSNVTKASEFEIASATPNTYTVTYEKNDGTGANVVKEVTFDAAWPEAPAFTRTGYTPVDGWFTGAADTAPAYTFTDTYTTVGNTTVYKHWTINKTKLTVDPAGGSVTVDGTAYTAAHTFEQDYNTTLTIPEPTKEGYHFTGWTREITNGTFAEGEYRFGPDKNVTDKLTATWEIDTFTVTLTKGVGYTVVEGPQSPVNWNTASSVTIRLDEAYSASAAPTATVNNGTVDVTVNTDGTITYTVAGIKENKTIVIGDATKNTYDVTFFKTDDAVGISAFTPSVNVEHGTGTATVTVTLEDAYSASDAPAVTLNTGSAEISGGVKSVVDGKTVYTYTVSNVTEASSFKIGPASPNTYTVSLNATRVGYEVTTMPAVTVLYDGAVTVAITLLDGYSETDENTIDFTVSNGTYTMSRTGNVITYTVSHIKANTEINIGSATINTYDVTLVANCTGYTVNNDPPVANVVEHGGSVEFTITLDDAHSDSAVPEISATNAGSAVGYKDGNTVRYIVTGVTNDTVINVGAATMNTYTVSVRPGDGAAIRLTAADDTYHDYSAAENITHVPYGTTYYVSLADPTATSKIYINGVQVQPDASGKVRIEVTQNTVITTDSLEYAVAFLNFDRTFYAQGIVVRGNTAAGIEPTHPVRADSTYHHYVFTGWLCDDAAFTLNTPVTKDLVFVAQYETYHQNLPLVNDGTHHWYECPECGYVEGKTEHVAGGIEIENVVRGTCTTKGSHDEVSYCAVCRYEMSRTTVDDGYDYTNHSTTRTYSVVLFEATCSEKGMKAYYCADCNGLVRTEELPVNPSAHTWGAWSDNGDGTHTRTCVYCGNDHAEGVQTKPHALDEIYRSAATCTNNGVIVSYCPICTSVLNTTLDATSIHIAGDPMMDMSTYTAPTCVAAGGYDSVRYCKICGDEMSRTHVTLDATGIHQYKVTYEPEATCTTDGNAVYKCFYCDDSYTETVKASGHNVTEWTVTVTPTASNPEGKQTGVCTDCGETIEETIEYKPLGQRFVQFIAQDGVTFSAVAYKQNADGTWKYDSNDVNVVKGTVTTYTNVDLHFFVTINSSFAYSDYDVYADGVKLAQNADGSYTLPASANRANVNVLGTTPAPINPGDSGVSGDSGSGSHNNGKLSFWERIVAFFRSIGDFFRNLFNR